MTELKKQIDSDAISIQCCVSCMMLNIFLEILIFLTS